MNAKRAQQIVESSGNFQVQYEGKSVMLQHVDEKSETARIYDRNNPENERTVPLNALEEM